MIINKDLIIEEVISQFELKHKGVHTEEQHFKCVRDTGYNFDAIAADLEQGGIKNILSTAKKYWQGTKSNLGKGEQGYALEVNKLLERRLLVGTELLADNKIKVSLLISILNEIVEYGLIDESLTRYETGMRKYIDETYDWDNEHRILETMQRCQRNWDYKKFEDDKIENKERHIAELLYVAQNSPSKQFESYFDLYWTADRKVIQELSRYTWGNTHRRNPPSTWRNTQANASIYIIWVAKHPPTQLNANADGTLKGNEHPERWYNAFAAIGISVGLTMRAAVKMGYNTGPNKSHNDLNGDDFWLKKLGILEDDNEKNYTKRIAYGLGIGYATEGRPRWEQDDTELMIGAANGGRITLTGQTRHPRTKLKMRKAKIIDIRGKENQKVKDPYGVEHIIPETTNTKINSSVIKRDIKVTEIK